MLRSVPSFGSRWSGTGTVIVEPGTLFCMTTWLPCRLSSGKPRLLKSLQTSAPESLRNLANRDLDVRHEDLTMEAIGDLGGVGSREEQLERLGEVGTRLLYRRSLAREVQLRTAGNKHVAFSLDDRGEVLDLLHGPIFLCRPPAFARCREGETDPEDESKGGVAGPTTAWP
jgi:hypothetical protein